MKKRQKLSQLIQTDPFTRLNNLYKITDKDGHLITFKMNWAQESMYRNMHRRNLVLKCRQIGSSTFWCLLLLDLALTRTNQNIGIISYDLDAASHLFKRVILSAFDNLPDQLKACYKIENKNAHEISFAHGSKIRCATTQRGGTLTALHISELGRIAARYPQKAQEVFSGSLNTLPKKSLCIIESTAEGAFNEFYDLCSKAQGYQGQLNELQYKFFFFPWWKFPEYTLDISEFEIPRYMMNYFRELEEKNITLTESQKVWYVTKYSEIGEAIFQEFPSTTEEAFKATNVASFYEKEISSLEEVGRITEVPYNKTLPTFVALDIGVTTCAFIFQVAPTGNVHLLDCFKDVGGSVDDIVKNIRSKPYIIDTWFFPHDAEFYQPGGGKDYITLYRAYGMKTQILPREPVEVGIARVKLTLPRCYFDRDKCEEGITDLRRYHRRFNAQYGMYGSEPAKDGSDHFADALRYLIQALDFCSHMIKSDDILKSHREFQEKQKAYRL